MKPRYSFVIPIYNEEESLPTFHERMLTVLAKLDGDAEVLLVNDGSRDKSSGLMNALHARDPRFKLLHLSRNFGHQAAITAGMDFAVGDALIIMDADLQDPPEVALEMIARWKEGFEVVYGQRADRAGESFFKRVTAKLFYRLLRRLTDVDMPQDVGDFRLVDRKALDAFRALRETHRYVRGMWAWIGFKQTAVVYSRAERFAGTTKYPLRKMLKLAKDGIISFSDAPLRLALNLGFGVAGLSFLAGIFAVVAKLTGVFTVSGWASITVIISFMGGVQLIVMGLMGEYIGRIYEEVRGRPLYIVRAWDGFDPKQLIPSKVVAPTQTRATPPSPSSFELPS